MKLGNKIIGGFLLVNFIFIILVSIVYVLTKPVQTHSDNLNDILLPVLKNSATVEFSMSMQFGNIRAFMLNPKDTSFWKAAQEYQGHAVEGIANLKNIIMSPGSEIDAAYDFKTQLNSMESNYNEYNQLASAVYDMQTTIIDNLTSIINNQDSFNTMLNDLVAIEEQQNQAEIKSNADISVHDKRLKRILSVRSVQTYSYQIIIQSLEGYILNRPENYLTAQDLAGKAIAVMKSLNDDPMANEASKKQNNDITSVLEKLTETIEILANETKKSIEQASTRYTKNQLSEKASANIMDMSTDLATKEALITKQSINRVVLVIIVGSLIALIISVSFAVILTKTITGSFNHLIMLIGEGADEVDHMSSQLSASSGTLAQGATENAASLEETSAALEELSSMTRRNADNSVEANSLMLQATDAVHKADLSMSDVIHAMDEISTSGNEISKIIKTIDEIAFQTNLLALNAAVEAARAGEAGAGFAVVADEVRNLAIRSADAAKNTADLIASTISNINAGSEMVHTTAENFKTVEAHSAKVAELLAEVAEASKEQSQGIGQITTAMTQMDKVTQSNAASAEESASAAGQLSLQATNLLDAVDAMVAMSQGAGVHRNRNQQHSTQRHSIKAVGAAPAMASHHFGNATASSQYHNAAPSQHHHSSSATSATNKTKLDPQQLIPMDDDFTDFN